MSSPNHAELRSSLQVLTSYVQSDKETKQRKRFHLPKIKCPQRAVLFHWYPKSTVLARATDV